MIGTHEMGEQINGRFTHTIRVDNASEMHLQLFNKSLENQVLPLKPDSFTGGLPNNTGLLAIMPKPYKSPQSAITTPVSGESWKVIPLQHKLTALSSKSNHRDEAHKRADVALQPSANIKSKTLADFKRVRSSPRWKNLIFQETWRINTIWAFRWEPALTPQTAPRL